MSETGQATARAASSVTEWCRAHVLRACETAVVGQAPFRHAFIENIFPAEFYDSLRAHLQRHKYGSAVIERNQDNPSFKNRRYNLERDQGVVARTLHAVFSDREVKQALLRKFYLRPTADLCAALRIHEEFEYVYTPAGKFQNIHVDIPPKFMSFVFYIPEREASEEEELHNATILYDRNLNPNYRARFRANSVCVFVPHFASYHGFSSTMERDALVMFYVDPAELDTWNQLRAEDGDSPPFAGIRDAIEAKLLRHPLIEFGADPERVAAEKATCLVNAPQGRVMRR